MKFFGTSSRALIASLALVLWVSGCGSASNDQGVAFTLLGYFSEVPTDPNDCSTSPAGLSGISVALSTASTEETPATESGVTAVLGLSNNLTQQFIRTQRIYLSYFIPGASVQPPSTSVALSAVINPAVPSDTATGAGTDSTLPPSFTGNACSRAFAETTVVPAEIRTWINFHRQYLPEAPFSMIVTASVQGITSAGDGYTSNDADLNVNWLPDTSIAPTESVG